MPEQPSFERPESSPETQRAQKINVHARMLGVSAGMQGPEAVKLQRELTEKTVLDGVHDAQRQLERSNCLQAVEAARGALGNILEFQNPWQSNLESLRSLLTQRLPNDPEGGTGNPIGILGHLANKREALADLDRKLLVETDPLKRQAIQSIKDAYRIVAETVGPVHPAVLVPGQQNSWNNKAVQDRGNYLLTVGAVSVLGGAGALLGALTFFSGEDDNNYYSASIFLGAAGVAAYMRYGKEVSFLGDPGSEWHALGIRGEGWAQFVEQYYQSGMRNDKLLAFVRERNHPTQLTKEQQEKREQQKEAILALAPQSIREQLRTMLTTVRGGVPGADFRTLDGLLRQSGTREAQGVIVRYIRSGATPQSLQVLNSPQRAA